MATLDDWLLFAPLWSIGLFAFGGMVAASFLAAAVRRRQARRIAAGQASPPADDADEGLMVSAVMGLLALLVAFTFSIAINRFEDRRANVVREANAIGTAYLRAQLLIEPHRSRISDLLKDYTDTRVVLASEQRGAKQAQLLNRSDQLVGNLWAATVAAFPSMRPYAYSNVVIEAINNLIDMDTVRKAGRQAHIPAVVFLALLFYQFMAAGVISYAVSGRGGRRTAFVLFLLLGVLMVLIIDVDRATSGGLKEGQEPMLQLQRFIASHPPEAFDRFNTPVEARPKNERLGPTTAGTTSRHLPSQI